MADRFPLIVNPGANQIQEIPGADNIVIPGQIKLTTTAASGSNGDSTIRISGDTSNVSRLLIEGKGSNTAGSFTNIVEFKLTNTTPVVKTTGSFEGGGIIPVGGIIMWSGTIASLTASAPNFKLCDGNNGTPDLRNKFVIGANADDGGVAKTNVETALFTDSDPNNPSSGIAKQSGGFKNAVLLSHTHTQSGGTTNDDGGAHVPGSPASGSAMTNISTTGINKDGADSTTQTGKDANLPPYFALAYIMRTT